MAFTAGELPVVVVATLAAGRRCLHALAIDARRARRLFAAGRDADLRSQSVHHLLQSLIVTPLGEVVVGGALGGQVVRQHVPPLRASRSPLDNDSALAVDCERTVTLLTTHNRPPSLIRGRGELAGGQASWLAALVLDGGPMAMNNLRERFARRRAS